ncbi:hypothetical protein PCANC_03505 [Puccinia coronata f. sp. avenae]|uniref:Ribosomal RNA methyltransferase FtsJ domain-containing protein n=1 Tax=Puccinia coronata f. sp. avenae TaxID=200324 RepID=A0A2N5W031_9BASI|nr:hypothetical protein PCANC_03505 [Puccinia coronata f. sp. avenae]
MLRFCGTRLQINGTSITGLGNRRGIAHARRTKLIQLDEQYGLFNHTVNRVIDLCAAPGSCLKYCEARCTTTTTPRPAG